MNETRLRGAAVFLAAAILLLLAAGPARAQDAEFNPFPGGADAYRADLERLFFVSPEAEVEARAELLRRARALAADSVPPASAQALERLLIASDSIWRLTGKHRAYLTLRVNLDTRETVSAAAADALGDSVGRYLAATGPALTGLSDDALRRFMDERPALRRFAYYFRRVRAPADGRRPDRLAMELLAPQTRWQPSLFWSLYAETDWGQVDAPEGRLDFLRQMSRIMNHPDRRVREAGYRLGARGRSQHRGTYAIALRENVTSRNALARARGFRDFREESYGGLALRPEQVGRTLEAIGAHGEVNVRYEGMRIEHLRGIAGLDSVHVWDLTLPEPGMSVPRLTVPEASRVVGDAMAVLGPDHSRELALLLDPRNGRLDLAPRENRSPRPGFSTGSVGYPSIFFQGRYEGYLPDLVIFAHELGHAAQNGMMEANGVAAVNAFGPSYFTESFAAFTELLVTDHLYRTAPDRAARIYFLQAFLDQSTGLFDNARTAQFEHLLYDSVPAGRLSSADDAERMMQTVGRRYSIWYARGERKDQWINHIQYFTNPLYQVNYAYSKLLALKYFQLYSRDRADFVRRYSGLLANGYDDEPGPLLRRFFGFDLDDPRLVDDAVAVIESRLAELDRLYASR